MSAYLASSRCHVTSLAVAVATLVGCFSDPLVNGTNTTTASTSSESGADTEAEGDSDTTGGPGPGDPIALASDADDGQIYLNDSGGYTWLPSGEEGGGFLGELPQGSEYTGYFRFVIPSAIPAGSTILEAHLEMQGATIYDWDSGNHALEIALQDVPDAPQVEDGSAYPYDGNPNAVALLPSRVRWPADGGLSWTVGSRNESPDLAPLLQALVDAHGGLAAGANVQFWVTKAPPLLSESEVGFVEYADNPGAAATLSLSFE